MLAVAQRGGQIFPGAIYCRSHRRQQRAIIVDGYPGTGFRRAVQYGTSIIGVSAVRQRSGSRHHVIKSLDNRWRKRGNSINNDVKSSGRWTNVSGCVGCCHRQRVVAVAQRCSRRENPCTAPVCRNGIDQRAVVVNFNR